MSLTEQPPAPPLTVRVVNGNLMFVRQPLILGHYRSIAPTGTEKVVDRFLGGALQELMDLGSYPQEPDRAEVFVNQRANESNPLQLPRPEAVIIVGLGDEGNLDSAGLASTVRHGVIAWARRHLERRGPGAAPFELAATFIGSGGTGMTAGHSARVVVQGVLEANERLARLNKPGVKRLEFVELFLDRATEAWRALREQAAATPGRWMLEETISTGQGALPRPLDASYRGASYDLIAAKTVKDDHAQGIAFILDTKRARTEVRANITQAPLLRELIKTAADSKQNDPVIRRTLFRMLVPLELESFLTGSSETLMELDGGTAGIPWELLDATANGDREGAGDTRPWAIRSKLLRKLQMANFRPQVIHPTGDTLALVIGEPAVDPKRYPRLPSAQAEAKAVYETLDQIITGNVRQLFSDQPDQLGPDALMVVNSLQERDWRIVHITGHGEPPKPLDGSTAPSSGGVVLSNATFLGPSEIRSMRVIPELVFVNCCHLAKRDSGQLLEDDSGLRRFDRPGFAASLAEALIREGVRCVIAAGWAVNDEPAKVFATTFYRSLARRRRFIDAVAEAREAAFEVGGNTWAAYQCYGDPDWTLHRDGEVQLDPITPQQVFINVASPAALLLALQTLTVKSRYDEAERQRLPANLGHLNDRFAAGWGRLGAVAEAFGDAWAECDNLQAIAWYKLAVAANDGTASLHATEQLGNLRVREAAKAAEDAKGRGTDQKQALIAARQEIESALALLQSVNGIAPSIERECLCGSAWKRLAMVEALAEDPEGEHRAIAQMRDHYLRAERMARESGAPNLFYPALNGMVGELIVDAAREGWQGFDPDRLAAIRACLEARDRDDPDFWSVADQIGLRVYQALAQSRLATDRPGIEEAYRDLKERVTSSRDWTSVRDQLRFVLSARRSWPEDERRAGQELLSVLDRLVGSP